MYAVQVSFDTAHDPSAGLRWHNDGGHCFTVGTKKIPSKNEGDFIIF